MKKKILEMNNIIKRYKVGEDEEEVLKSVSLIIEEGDFISIVGPSGSGKSTLMNLIGCLDTPTSGEYELSGHAVNKLSEQELAKIRNKEIGFVFQQFHLLQRFSALKNVELPLVYSGISEKKRNEIALSMLEKVGLENKIKSRPNQLSGGQQQRVAIARAMATNPTILLADEPTGALDQKTGQQIIDLFHKLHQEGKTIVMITHDMNVAKNAKRIINILDGELSEVKN